MALTDATMCYECGILDSTCNDNDDMYGMPDADLSDCTGTLKEDGGCSKSKSKTKLLGNWIETSLYTCQSICKEIHDREYLITNFTLQTVTP